MTREDLPTRSNKPFSKEGFEYAYNYIKSGIETGYLRIMKKRYMDLRTTIEDLADFYINKGDVYCAIVEISKEYKINSKKWDEEWYMEFSIKTHDMDMEKVRRQNTMYKINHL